MMKQLPDFASLRRLLVPWLLGCTLAHAQTAIWRGPVVTDPNTSAFWHFGDLWNTGSAPYGATATAVIQDGVIDDFTSPLRADVALTLKSDLTELGGIRFDSAGGSEASRIWPDVYVERETTPAPTLRLTGFGIDVPVRAPNAPRLWLGFLGNGPVMEFTGSATISGSPPSSDKTGTGHAVRITVNNGATLRFRDQSSAGSGALFIHPGARLEFSGTGSGGRALILGGGGRSRLTPDQLPAPAPDAPDSLISFRGGASLEHALIRTDGRVEFHDNATAGRGFIESTGETWFFGQSTAGQAVVQRGGGSLIFMDQSTAGSALIYSPSLIEFRRQSSAGTAMIRADILRFRDSANAGSAWVVGANRLEVLDQADLSKSTLTPRISDSIRVRVLDLSGARTASGSSARIAASQGAAAGTVVADNAREVGVRSLWSLGTDSRIHLGSNTLVLEGYATIQGRITDAGGAYRDDANRDFTGGGLIIRGGYMQVSHPDNNYSGETRVESGTLALAGGALSKTVINQHAVLQGSGTIRGHLINNGTVNTDLPSLGANRTLTVQGDYHQGVTGNLQMRMRTDDRNTLNIAGQATLAGGILHFYGGEPFSAGATIGFFNAASRSGQWAAINLPGVAAGWRARVSYTATGAQLVIEPAATISSLHGATLAPEEQLVVLTPLGYRSDTEVRSVFGLGTAPVETLVQAVAAHDPAAYSLLPAGSRLSALALQQDVEKFSRTDPGVLPERTLILVGGLQQRRESFAPAAGPAGDGRAGGFVSGGIWRADAITVGGLLAYESARHTPSAGGTFSLDRVSPGLFARAGLGDTFLAVSATYTHEEYDLSRPIVFPGTNLVARAAPRAARIDAGVLAGHSFRLGPCRLVPSAGVFATRWRLSEVTESGVPAGAAVLQGWRDRALLARLGLDLEAGLPDQRVTARLSLRWLHELDSARELGVSFAGLPENFALAGLPTDTDLFQAGLRAECRLSRQLTASLGAGLTHGRTARITSEFSGGLRWDF